MRWPFVSREAYVRLTIERDYLAGQAEQWREQHASLLALFYRAVMAQGAIPPDPNEFIPQPQSVDETDEERALEELHG